jgi:ATP-binding cassette subfamily F protein uup
MDEPTNDLDAETLDLLEEMVADYNGTLLLVSHDRAFLDNVVTSTLVFEGNGQINEYVGGYTDWLRQRRVAAPGLTAVASNPAKPAVEAEPAVAAELKSPVKARRLSYNEQRELKQLPEKIQALEAEQAQLTTLISDPALFQRNQEQGSEALQRLQAVGRELDAAYARWEALDQASSANRA